MINIKNIANKYSKKNFLNFLILFIMGHSAACSASVCGARGHRFKSCWFDHDKINDLADKLLILFGHILLFIRTWSDFAPKIIQGNRSKTSPKSIKVFSKIY